MAEPADDRKPDDTAEFDPVTEEPDWNTPRQLALPLELGRAGDRPLL